MSENQKQILYYKSRTIDLQRMGSMHTTNLTYLLAYDKTYTDYIEHTIRWTVAQAMLQGVGGGTTEGALIVRDLSPMYDLLNGLTNGPPEMIWHNQWIQDYWYGIATAKSSIGYDNAMVGAFDMYLTDRNVRNDQKVIVIYGIELLNPNRKPLAQEIQFWRGSVKLSARYPLDFKTAMAPPEIKNIYLDEEKGNVKSKGITLAKNTFYHNPVMFFDEPIIYKKDDLLKIRAVVPFSKLDVSTKEYNKDEVKLLGFVVEPIGLTTIG
jgi:hypothetical protein